MTFIFVLDVCSWPDTSSSSSKMKSRTRIESSLQRAKGKKGMEWAWGGPTNNNAHYMAGPRLCLWDKLKNHMLSSVFFFFFFFFLLSETRIDWRHRLILLLGCTAATAFYSIDFDIFSANHQHKKRFFFSCWVDNEKSPHLLCHCPRRQFGTNTHTHTQDIQHPRTCTHSVVLIASL